MRALALLALSLAACSPLTEGEAQETLEEAQLAAEAEALVAGAVTLGTNFTLGGDPAAAAAELAAGLEAALPCAGVEVRGAAVDVEHDACDAGGATPAGAQTITVTQTDPSAAAVTIDFDGLRDDAVAIDGSVTVTFASPDASRRIVGALTYTRLADGRTAAGSGDRRHTPLEALDGFEVDGAREFRTERGDWTLTFDAARMRLVDPLPEAGRYVLDTPFGEGVALRFRRPEPAKIAIVAESGARTYDFEVTTTERP
jgi:hypothetical protein